MKDSVNDFMHDHPLPDITMVSLMAKPEELLNEVSSWPLAIHMLTAVICLGFSTTYHLFFVKSEHVQSWMSRMDYAGISILIAGSTIPPYYYGFYCKEEYCKCCV